jgi:molybdopterin converting factor subunit 1
VLVTVRLFARLREIAGTPDLRVELPDGSTVRDAWEAVVTKHRGIDALTSSVSCAVNEEYSRMSAPVRDGDEVAFLPPVSGGCSSGPVADSKNL